MKAPVSLEDKAAHALAENRLGKYRLVATLGRGGMADVYLAMLEGPSGFSKLLVVKELRQDSLDDGVGVQMFLDEARLAARLNHPNIVQTLEVGSDGDRCFLAMEYVDGQSIRRVMSRARTHNTPIPLHTHLRILVDVLSALEYAHSLKAFDGTPLGIVHRDVSPQNVILTYEGHVKLIDFGIAKTALASSETREGIVKGKVKYMPPEQATGHVVDARTDVFSVGILLWEALLGHGPWHGESDVAIFRALMSGAVPRLSKLNPTLDSSLVTIVDRAISADPRDRYPTAAAMRDDLESWLATRRSPSTKSRDLPVLLCALFEKERRDISGLIDTWTRGPDSQHSTPPSLSLTRMRTGTTEATRTPPSISKFATMPSVCVSPIPPPPDSAPKVATPSKSRSAVGAVAVAVIVASAVVAASAAVHSRSPTARPGPLATGEVPLPASNAAAEARLPVSKAALPSVNVVASAPLAVIPSSHVEIHSSPPWARLYVDDAPVANPYSADLPRDGTSHSVRAEAPGYFARTSSFVTSLDRELRLALERGTWRPSPPLPRAPVESAATPHPEHVVDVIPDGAKAHPPVPRPIEPDNPYPQ